MPVLAFVDAFDTMSMPSARRATAVLQIIWRLKRFFNNGDERKLRESMSPVDGFTVEVTRQRHKLGGAASGSGHSSLAPAPRVCVLAEEDPRRSPALRGAVAEEVADEETRFRSL